MAKQLRLKANLRQLTASSWCHRSSRVCRHTHPLPRHKSTLAFRNFPCFGCRAISARQFFLSLSASELVTSGVPQEFELKEGLGCGQVPLEQRSGYVYTLYSLLCFDFVWWGTWDAGALENHLVTTIIMLYTTQYTYSHIDGLV